MKKTGKTEGSEKSMVAELAPKAAAKETALKAKEAEKRAQTAVAETAVKEQAPKAKKVSVSKAEAAKKAAFCSGNGKGIKKQYTKTGERCKVTFALPRDAVHGAKSVNIVGDFNDWDEDASPMKKLKDGSFSIILELEKGKAYRFRYLIDGSRWENDWCADRYERNPHGSEDSVVII